MMRLKFFIAVLLVSLIFDNSCKIIKKQQINDVFSHSLLTTDQEISIEIINKSSQIVEFNNLKMLIIQKVEEDTVVRIPYNPCRCGVPCNKPGIPKRVETGGKVKVTWNYISRKCGGFESTEYRIEAGKYRIGVNYRLIENNRIVESDTYFIDLSIQ